MNEIITLCIVIITIVKLFYLKNQTVMTTNYINKIINKQLENSLKKVIKSSQKELENTIQEELESLQKESEDNLRRKLEIKLSRKLKKIIIKIVKEQLQERN